MHLRAALFSLSFLIFLIFIVFSYTVAKEAWTQIDFDTTVKLQDRIPRKVDEFFSFFSLLGNAEVTIGLAIFLAILSLLKRSFLSFLGWLLIIPATFVTVFGKLFIYHPSPPNFLLRTIDLSDSLPKFYIHSEYSYPSGHVTRTIFLITALGVVVFFSKKSAIFKIISLGILFFVAFMMMLTRIYLGEHWLSDVLGGAFIGSSGGLFASIFLLNKVHKRPLAAN